MNGSGVARGQGPEEDAPLREALNKVVAGAILSDTEARDAFEAIMDGRASPTRLAALLVALRMRGETVGEIAAFARVMRERATRVRTDHSIVVDTCGTGGDGSGTFNISTLAAFVVAASGVAVAKHGNRAVSGRCGSADLLQGLGIRIDQPVEMIEKTLREIRFGFLYAPGLHRSVRHAAAVRRELGVRTVFNLLGPLANPAGARRQLLGVYDSNWVEPVARVLKELGSERAMVVHGQGLDEIALHGETRVAQIDGPEVWTSTLTPESAGLPRARLDDLLGGDVGDNVAIAREVLGGGGGPRRDVVLLNAGAALLVAGKARALREGVAIAAAAIDSGAALGVVERLRDLCPSQGTVEVT